MSDNNKIGGSIFDKIKSNNQDVKKNIVSGGSIFNSKNNKVTISIGGVKKDEGNTNNQLGNDKTKLFQNFLSHKPAPVAPQSKAAESIAQPSAMQPSSARGHVMTKADFASIKKSMTAAQQQAQAVQKAQQLQKEQEDKEEKLALQNAKELAKNKDSASKKNKPQVIELDGDGLSAIKSLSGIEDGVDASQSSGALQIKITASGDEEGHEASASSDLQKTARDNRLINKILNEFEYEEFDGDVNSLEEGKNLRAQIEKMRDDTLTFDDYNDVADLVTDDVKKKKSNARRHKQPIFKKAKNTGGEQVQQAFIKKTAFVYDSISVLAISKQISVKTKEVIKTLHSLGINADEDYVMDFDTAEIITHELGHDIAKAKNINEALEHGSDGNVNLVSCCPVVTIMGHVDHGKTTLLDTIRKADVALGESGGITQHIGAYKVKLDDGREITFIDTPGHAAFTAMRSRGASSTNIVIIVVAADDGIMQQTAEAISHAKAAGVPIIVAINKIDNPGADVARVKNELLQYDLVPEELGGDVMVVPVSAKLGKNIDALLDAILLQAEVLDLKADLNSKPSGVVLEANIDSKVGIVATLLLQNGTLKKGDIILAGDSYGRVRSMMDDTGKSYDQITPQTPVQVYGFGSIPRAGDKFFYAQSDKIAKQVTDYKKAAMLKAKTAVRPSMFDAQAKKTINIIIKSDSQGTNEAIIYSVGQMKFHEDIAVKIIHSGTGNINESDALLAKANGAKIFAFRVAADSKSDTIIKREKLDARTYSVIYELLNEIEKLAEDSVEKQIEYDLIGAAEVREIFNISKQGKIAGCYVIKGSVKQKARVKVIRGTECVFEGNIENLKRFKENAKEVNTGFECGIQIAGYEELAKGDLVEVYEEKK